MRSTLRRLAKVKPGQYLEPHTPTGLTGIRTHPSPRPTLIYTYSRTLEKLKTLPESSAYRQSTEALTRHRLKIVEDTKPAGFDTWLERSKQRIAENPELYEFAKQPDGSYKFSSIDQVAGAEPDTAREDPEVEGPYSEEIKGNIAKKIEKDIEENVKPEIEWEAEPPLDAAQYGPLSIYAREFGGYCLCKDSN